MRKSKRHANTSSRFYLIISRLKQFLHIWNSQYKRKDNILNTFSLIISSSISLYQPTYGNCIDSRISYDLTLHAYIYIYIYSTYKMQNVSSMNYHVLKWFFFWVKNYLIFHEFFFYFMISGKKNHIMHQWTNIYIYIYMCVCLFF